MWNLEEAGADRHKLHTKGPTQSDTRIALGGPGWTLELCLLGACPRLFLGPFPPFCLFPAMLWYAGSFLLLNFSRLLVPPPPKGAR